MNLKTEKETLMGSKKTDLMRISYFVAIVILVCLIGNLKDLWLQSWTDLIIYLIVLFAAAECLFSTFARIRAVGELLQNQYRIGLSRLERVVRERMTTPGSGRYFPAEPDQH